MNTTTLSSRRIVAAGFSLAAAAFGAACGGSAPGDATSPAVKVPATCAKTGSASDEAPVIVVAADPAAGGATGESAERQGAFSTILDVASDRSARLMTENIGTGIGSADLGFNGVLTGEGPNALLQESDLKCRQAAAQASFDHMLATEPPDSKNIFSTLDVIAAHLHGMTPSETDIVLFSDMYNTAPPLDFDDPSVHSLGDEGLVALAGQHGLLPNCEGWNVHIYGRPSPGSDASTLPLVRSFWIKLFAACGGQVVAYDTELTVFPSNTPIESGPRIPPIASSTSTSGPLGTTSTTSVQVTEEADRVLVRLPGDILFDTNQVNVRPEAEVVLVQVADLLRNEYSAGLVEISGHTDSQPTRRPGGNAVLSKDRALQIVNSLADLGVPRARLHAEGYGDSQPIADNGTQEGRAINRRVEISIIVAA